MTAMEHVAVVMARLGPESHVRIERCACGGEIRANAHEPAVYVSNHNRSKQHQAWRRRMGYDAR